MHALLVIAHPEDECLSRALARQVAAGLAAAEGSHTLEWADLAREGFDPRYTRADNAYYRGQGNLAADIGAEQARVDRADALVLVFPIYWWSMPAMLKGWIDRVFSVNWAFRQADGGAAMARFNSRVHVLAVGADTEESFARRGYDAALRTQIEQGIFGYCGIEGAALHTLLDCDSADDAVRQRHLAAAFAIGRGLFGPAPAGP